MRQHLPTTCALGCLTLVVNTQLTLAQSWLSIPAGLQNHYVVVGDIDVSGTALTVEALISVRDTLWGPGENVVSKHHSPNDVNYLLREISFEIRTSQGYLFLTNPLQLCPDSVYHIAGTYDGDTARYFLNGVEVNAAAHSGALTTNNLMTAIGNRASLSDEQFKGYLDEVRIWAAVRSPAEIAANMYDLPDPQNASGLLAYYKFEGDYVNALGTGQFDGVPVGAGLSMTMNPHFTGGVSTDFGCFITCTDTTLVIDTVSCTPVMIADSLYTTSAMVMEDLVTFQGCDSTVIHTITISPLDTTVVVDQGVLTAQQANATYQWMDCQTGLLVPDATQQSFTPAMNGSYAVTIDNGVCTGSSGCHTMIGTSVHEMVNSANPMTIWPNPTSGAFTIKLPASWPNAPYQIVNATGQVVRQLQLGPGTQQEGLDLPAGFYVLRNANDARVPSQVLIIQ